VVSATGDGDKKILVRGQPGQKVRENLFQKQARSGCTQLLRRRDKRIALQADWVKLAGDYLKKLKAERLGHGSSGRVGEREREREKEREREQLRTIGDSGSGQVF
jgi:hypothetical protein